MRIVYVLPSRCGLGLSKHDRNIVNVTRDYNSLHWRPPHINGVHFAEVDSYDIRGLSAMIHRTVPHHRIRYILGATGAGRSRLSRHGDNPLSSFDYVFIKNDETVRAWLLSNPVLDDPLELMLYCYRDRNDRQQDTPALTRVNYLAQNDVSKWARDPEARIGHMHIREARDLAYSESAPSSDTDGTNNKHTSHISKTSSPGSDSGDRREFRPNLFLHNESGSESSSHVSESETAGDNIPDILPLNGVILAL